MSRQKRQKFARFFSEMNKIPIGSHGPPKPVSNSALFQGQQPCESARAVLALLSALDISLFSRLGIQNMTGNIGPTSTDLSRELSVYPSKAKLYAVNECRVLFYQCHSQLAAGQAATQRSQGDGDSPKPPNHSQPYPRADVEVTSGKALQAERRLSIHWVSQLPTV